MKVKLFSSHRLTIVCSRWRDIHLWREKLMKRFPDGFETPRSQRKWATHTSRVRDNVFITIHSGQSGARITRPSKSLRRLDFILLQVREDSSSIRTVARKLFEKRKSFWFLLVSTLYYCCSFTSLNSQDKTKSNRSPRWRAFFVWEVMPFVAPSAWNRQ